MIDINEHSHGVIDCYGTPIVKLQAKDFDQHQADLIERCYWLKDKDRTSGYTQRSNRGSFHSSAIREEDWRDFECGNWFVDTVMSNVNRAIKLMAAPTHKDMKFDESWTIIMRQRSGQWNVPHDHGDNFLSGALYLKANESNENLQNGMAEFMALISNPAISSLYNNASYQLAKYSPVEGELMIFPSSMTHMVSPHLSRQDRIMISFNILGNL